MINKLRHTVKFQVLKKKMGSIPAIQLAHAGRKGSAEQPWKGGSPIKFTKGNEENQLRSWKTIAPSPIPLGEGWQKPEAISLEEIDKLISDYVNAAKRSIEAGFEIIEIHAAHGYLLHSFLSLSLTSGLMNMEEILTEGLSC